VFSSDGKPFELTELKKFATGSGSEEIAGFVRTLQEEYRLSRDWASEGLRLELWLLFLISSRAPPRRCESDSEAILKD